MSFEGNNTKNENIETIKNAAVMYEDKIFEGTTRGHAFGKLLSFIKENKPELYKECKGDEYALVALLESTDDPFDFEGFITSTNRYVSRSEALKIASQAKQLQKKKMNGDLYSEELK